MPSSSLANSTETFPLSAQRPGNGEDHWSAGTWFLKLTEITPLLPDTKYFSKFFFTLLKKTEENLRGSGTKTGEERFYLKVINIVHWD